MGMSIGSVEVFFEVLDESYQPARICRRISIGNGCILTERGCRSAVSGPAEHCLCQGVEVDVESVCHGCRDVSSGRRGVVVVRGVD